MIISGVIDMKTNKGKRILCILLTVCICASIFALPVSAQENFTVYANDDVTPIAPIQTTSDGKRIAGGDTERVNYVSLGESFSNAFGYEDYYVVDDDPQSVPNELGFGAFVAAKEGYPYKLAQHYNADLYQLAVSCMRCEDLYATLDPEGFKASYISTIDTDPKDTVGPGDDYFNRTFYRSNGKYVDMAKNLGYTAVSADEAWSIVSNAYNKAIKGADVISLCIGLNNLGCYQLQRLSGKLDSNTQYPYLYNDKINEAMQKEIDRDPLLRLQMKELGLIIDIPEFALCVASAIGGSAIDEVLSGVTDSVAPVIKSAMDSLFYGYAGMCLNFKYIYKYIRESNKDAELIVLSQPNMLSGMKFGVNIPVGDSGAVIPVSLDLGSIWNIFIDKYETYIKSVIAADRHKVYLNFPQADTFLDQLKSCGGDITKIDRDYLAAIIKLEFGTDVKKDFGVTLKNSRFHYDLADIMLGLSKGNVIESEIYSNNSVACDKLYDNLLSLMNVYCKAANLPFVDVPALMSGLDGIDLDSGLAQRIMELADDPETEDVAYALANIYAQAMLGDGLTIHPSDAGHTQIAWRIMQSCPDFSGNTGHSTLLCRMFKTIYGSDLAVALRNSVIFNPLRIFARIFG